MLGRDKDIERDGMKEMESKEIESFLRGALRIQGNDPDERVLEGDDEEEREEGTNQENLEDISSAGLRLNNLKEHFEELLHNYP